MQATLNTINRNIDTFRFSKASLITGRVISALCILFLLFDSIMKVIRETHSLEGSAAVGWPVEAVQGIGIALLISTILYIIPRTAVFGAILITGYLGGAMAIMIRAGQPMFFAAVVAVLVWLGLYLRDARVKALLS